MSLEPGRGNGAGAPDLLPELAALVSTAGARILELGGKGVRAKPDASLVTDADEAAEAILRDGIERLTPGIPIIAEEAVARGEGTAPAGNFFLVDPLDGTREFAAGRKEFTINVALVIGGVPKVGLVYAPAGGMLWVGAGNGAMRVPLKPGERVDGEAARPIAARPRPAKLVAAVSRSHLDPATKEFLAKLRLERRITAGSAIKFCRIAEGAADVYPRLAPVSEWDVAAGHALLVAAGGSVVAPDGSALTYGNAARGFLVDAFVAWGAPAED